MSLVREMVRDLIAEFVAVLAVRLPLWLAQEGLTFGLATPVVVAQVSALVAKWAARISRLLLALVDSLRRLLPIVRRLDDLLGELTGLLRRAGTLHHLGPGGHTPRRPDRDGDRRPDGLDPDRDGDGRLDDLDGDGGPTCRRRSETARRCRRRRSTPAAVRDRPGAHAVPRLRSGEVPDDVEREEHRLFVRDGLIYRPTASPVRQPGAAHLLGWESPQARSS